MRSEEEIRLRIRELREDADKLWKKGHKIAAIGLEHEALALEWVLEEE